MGIISVFLGLIPILLFPIFRGFTFVYMPFVNIIGLILGILAVKNTRGKSGIAGIILNSVGLVGVLLLMAIIGRSL